MQTCSFCAKSQNQVLKMIAGPGVSICDDCIALCVQIIADEASAGAGDEAAEVARRLKADLEEMRRRLGEGVEGP